MTADASAAKVTLSGSAVKGPMAKAEVGIYAVGADGKPAGTALVTTETGDDGSYSITFDGLKDQPYVVIVKAKAGTTHRDEATGVAQALPDGFQMRALVIPAAAGTQTTSATVTPFSELEVAAAEKATGGISVTNARQAESTVQQMLGFDPKKVAAKTTTSAESEDEKKLAVLLTAVSKLAKDGKLGCDTAADGGAKTKCVVEKLRDASHKDSIKLGDDDDSTASELKTAIDDVLADDNLKGTVDPSTMTAVQGNLGCTTTCEAAPVSTLTAIAATRKLFTDIAADWRTLFSSGGASAIATGATNAQAFRFVSEMPKLQQPVDTMLSDTQVMVMGIDLFKSYTSGQPGTGRGEGRGSVPSNAPFAFFNLAARGCTLYQDAATSVVATAPANANFIGCSSRFYARQETIATGVRNTYYRHGFTITPNLDGSFGWASRARETIEECSAGACVQVANNALQTNAVTGTMTPTISAAGQPTAVAITGELPAAFARDGFAAGSYVLANDKHSIAINATAATDAASGAFTGLTLTGSFDGKDAAGATTASLAIKTGKLTTIPVAYDGFGNAVAPGAPGAVAGSSGFEPGGFELDLVLATAGAKFEGIFAASETLWDKSRSVPLPTKLSFKGILSTIEAGVTTDFLTGTFTATASGWTDFDATQPQLATNRYTQAVSLVGTATAPGRPQLELSFGAQLQTNNQQGQALGTSLQYRSVVAGVARTVVAITGSPDAAGEINRFTLTEASANLAMSWVGGATTISLTSGGVEIGVLDVGRRLITFKDHTSMSLDLGL
ncbi:hypothetical protein [Rubrivivax sp. A210]|uniref:hypothetical protein n=1 Tax=Rubrivivax sp. A210 TaxID=2772301 RepID=UPI00191931BF|nr:hypothetical protein [Rubrivivax sp. A210]